MTIAELGTAPATDSVMLELEKYGLVQYALELTAYGVTIIPPEKMRPAPGFVDRLKSAILRTCERRNNLEIGDPDNCTMRFSTLNQRIWNLLKEDEVFVEAVTNPCTLAMARWLLGSSCVLSSTNWIIKPRNRAPLNLHSDAHGIPPGGGHIAHTANLSWLCTDYTGTDDGPTVFVPGSHRYGRATLPHEQDLETTPFKTISLNAKAGSMAIWHGGTWHGAMPREEIGLRVTLVLNYMRRHMRPIHEWTADDFSPEIRAKYPEIERILPPRFYPWEDENEHPERGEALIRTGTDPFE